MTLEETTSIEAPPERVFDFFRHMDDQRYREWHPDHLTFRWIEGDTLQEGSVCYFEEHIRGTVTKKSVRYTTAPDVFTVEDDGTATGRRPKEEFCIIGVTVHRGDSNFVGRDTSYVHVF